MEEMKKEIEIKIGSKFFKGEYGYCRERLS